MKPKAQPKKKGRTSGANPAASKALKLGDDSGSKDETPLPKNEEEEEPMEGDEETGTAPSTPAPPKTAGKAGKGKPEKPPKPQKEKPIIPKATDKTQSKKWRQVASALKESDGIIKQFEDGELDQIKSHSAGKKVHAAVHTSCCNRI